MKVWDGMGFATSEESGVVVMFLKYLQLYNYNDLYVRQTSRFPHQRLDNFLC